MKAGLGSRSYMGIGPIEFYNVGNLLGNKLKKQNVVSCCFKYTWIVNVYVIITLVSN